MRIGASFIEASLHLVIYLLKPAFRLTEDFYCIWLRELLRAAARHGRIFGDCMRLLLVFVGAYSSSDRNLARHRCCDIGVRDLHRSRIVASIPIFFIAYPIRRRCTTRSTSINMHRTPADAIGSGIMMLSIVTRCVPTCVLRTIIEVSAQRAVVKIQLMRPYCTTQRRLSDTLKGGTFVSTLRSQLLPHSQMGTGDSRDKGQLGSASAEPSTRKRVASSTKSYVPSTSTSHTVLSNIEGAAAEPATLTQGITAPSLTLLYLRLIVS